MFGSLFGWRKASKCKKVVKRAQCRIRLLKNKKNAIVRQSREDVAELVKYGYEEIALNRVEQLVKDENLATVYELLDQFCEFVLVHLSYIRRHKDCPNDINEAVSSLIYASARCGDLPELCCIRKLFGHRYGQRFAATAMELFPGNLVNIQLKEKLSVKSVPDDLKFRVIDEIARDNCIQPEVLAIEYHPDWQLTQVKENNAHQVVNKDSEINDTIVGSEMVVSEVKEIKRDIVSVDSSGNNSLSKSSPQDYGASNSSALVSTIQPYPPYIINAPLHEKVEKVENSDDSSSLASSGLKGKGQAMDLPSAQGFHTYPEELLVYLDDIEERQFSVSKYGGLQDQRQFKFRTSSLPGRKKIEFVCDQSDTEGDESQSEKSSRKSLKKSKRESEKRSRRRSVSLGNQSIMDIECMIYYYKPCKSPSAHYPRKQQKLLVEETPKASYSQKRLKEYNSSEIERNLDSSESEGRAKSTINLIKNACSLDYPCYFSVHEDKDSLTGKPNRGIRTLVDFPKNFQKIVLFGECGHGKHFLSEESTEEMADVKIFKKPRRRNYCCAEVYNVFTYPDCLTDKQTKEIKAENSEYPGSFASSGVSCLRTIDCLTRMERAAPYSRALTMPPERLKDNKDKMVRTFSCPSQHPNHVHPKLPEYDDLAAQFAALKKERLENKQLCATSN